MAELASHMVAITDWFFGAQAVAAMGSGGVYRFRDEGREVPDHTYVTLEYPGGATPSSPRSSRTRSTTTTSVLRHERHADPEGEVEAYLFERARPATRRGRPASPSRRRRAGGLGVGESLRRCGGRGQGRGRRSAASIAWCRTG